MDYTVKQIAQIAGVTARTLHYYDQIGLLKPSSYADNGYRHYQPNDLLRLQQILFYKELGFRLNQIDAIIDQHDFDILGALDAHKLSLEQKVARLKTLIGTVENTILHLKGQLEMSNQELFQGFDEAKQKEYESEIKDKYGDKRLNQSQRRWKSYTKQQKDEIIGQGDAIFRTIADHIDKGIDSPDVQEHAAAYHHYIHTNFYDCSYEVLGGLGQMYVEDPRFRATFDAIHPALAEFTRDAFAHYAEGKSGYPK